MEFRPLNLSWLELQGQRPGEPQTPAQPWRGLGGFCNYIVKHESVFIKKNQTQTPEILSRPTNHEQEALFLASLSRKNIAQEGNKCLLSTLDARPHGA